MKTFKDIRRKAIDSSGLLGHLYDARQDRVVKLEHGSVIGETLKLSKSPYCEIKNDNTDKSLNLLQFIDIEDDLQLNLLLDITKRVGIASVMSYSRPINEYTRFLYYSWTSEKLQITTEPEKIQELTKSVDPQSGATHIITSIDYGVDFVAAIQLPSETGIVIEIDRILHRIQHALLNNSENMLKLTHDETLALDKIINLTIYSNVSPLLSINRMSDVLYQIDRVKRNLNNCYSLTYYLQPIEWFNSQYLSSNVTFKELSTELNQQIIQYILRFRNPIRYLEASLKPYMTKYLYGHLHDRIYDARQRCSTLKDVYSNMVRRLSDLVIGARNGQYDASIIYQKLHDNKQIIFTNNIDQLTADVFDLKKTVQLETYSRQEPLNHFKVPEEHFNGTDTMRTTDSTVRMNMQHNKILYTNSALNNNNQSQSNDFRQISVNTYTGNPNIPFVSIVDRTCPSSQMKGTTILPLNNMNDKKNEPEKRTLSPIIVSQNILSGQPTPPNDEIINILLLGETGVGKSTFTNALTNYLSFDSLDHAQLNKPVVIIPVSFVMTIGDNFEERTVAFGDCDSSNNEDFHHPGHSVTQHCESYVFHLNDGSKLRIIDTPGFGDMRGLSHDDLNMEHILEYINNLTQINAICFLLKPNTSRLNVFIRSCLTQLFDFLGPNASKNLIYCFTNARSTFYNLGDTAPLLKSMLESLSVKDIASKKDNTFRFNNESFRYLVALQNKIPFDDNVKHKYEMSWSISAKESNRLIDYIRTKLTAQRIQDGCQSIKHAQFKIIQMIRPILETVRNILRNTLLRNIESSNKSIELCSTVIHRPAYLCLSCNSKIIPIGNFWITEDDPHEIQKTCFTCQCPSDKHIQIDYLLNYKLINSFSKYHISEMKAQLLMLCVASGGFIHFLINVACCTKENHFLAALKRMIAQEKKICTDLQPNYLNAQLVQNLDEFRQKHEERINEIVSKQEHINLTIIYHLIGKVNQIPLIEEQLSAIRKGKEIMMKYHELKPIQI